MDIAVFHEKHMNGLGQPPHKSQPNSENTDFATWQAGFMLSLSALTYD